MLPGVFRAIQARSRSASRATLVLYLAAIFVMGFGHRCADHRAAGPGVTTRPSGTAPVFHTHSSRGAAQQCLACTWQRSTVGLIPATLPVFVTRPGHVRLPSLLIIARASAPVSRVSRGPPHA